MISINSIVIITIIGSEPLRAARRGASATSSSPGWSGSGLPGAHVIVCYIISSYIIYIYIYVWIYIYIYVLCCAI